MNKLRDFPEFASPNGDVFYSVRSLVDVFRDRDYPLSAQNGSYSLTAGKTYELEVYTLSRREATEPPRVRLHMIVSSTNCSFLWASQPPLTRSMMSSVSDLL